MAGAQTQADIPPHFLNLWRFGAARDEHPRGQQLCRVVCYDGPYVLVRFLGQGDLFEDATEYLSPHMLFPELPPDRLMRRLPSRKAKKCR